MNIKITLSKQELEKLTLLAGDKNTYLKVKSSDTKDLIIRGLMEKFGVLSLENLLRSCHYYGFVEFKDKKYQQAVFQIAKEQNKRYCAYRRTILQIGFECPEDLSLFYFDIYKLKQDKLNENIKAAISELSCSGKIKNYLNKYQLFLNSLSNKNRNEFIHIYKQLFTTKENNTIAIEMKEIFNSAVAGIACQVRNYIDDVFPIFISDSLSKKESKFIEFLVYEGNSIDYMISENKSIEWLINLKNRLIKKYAAKDLNELVIIYLIEKNYHADNRAYLNLLLNINIDNVLKNLKLISRLTVRTNKPRVEQIMASLNELRVNKVDTIVKSGRYKQLTDLLNEAANQNII